MRTLRIAMAQIDAVVGDIAANARRIASMITEARKKGADLVVFPELAITGYPPEDLLLRPRFIADNQAALDELAHHCVDIVAVVGYAGPGAAIKQNMMPFPIVTAARHELCNAAAIMADGRLIATYGKQVLPNYGVFDEARYFLPGRKLPVCSLRGIMLTVNICEEAWSLDEPAAGQGIAGAEVVLNINASPFHIGKSRVREQILSRCAKEHGVIVTYTNMVGGQDELIFDGNSVILDRHGEVIARAKAFEEDLLVADLNVEGSVRSQQSHGRRKSLAPPIADLVEHLSVEISTPVEMRSQLIPHREPALGEMEEVYKGLVWGVKDYVKKNGFKRVIIGLSGGIDSAFTAAVAVDALGSDNVVGVFMPSPYTSRESAEDVVELSSRLGIECQTLSITHPFESYLHLLAPAFQGKPIDTTEENLQARIRGNILMALSNKFGHLVLTTGNKSEMSVGYATLYGDMAGGFAVIKDVPKTLVYELAQLRNRQEDREVIPQRILDRPPTAELKPNQKDEDSLPPYSVLDPILKAYVEEDRSVEEIVGLGFDRVTVTRVVNLVDQSEYKRRQAPVGITITHRGLGKDRRMPITNGYRNS